MPDILKISRVTPLHKSDSKTNPNNYRPISTLSSFSKVLEKIVHDQLQVYLEKRNILFEHQFGFRKNYSTEHAILDITDNLKTSIDKKLITCALFLDFSKAFDTVNHEILLQKLYKYGIRGVSYNWFQNYLTDRKQYVQIQETKSTLQTIKCGVPQGSTLGPLLFLLYINDIANTSNKLSFRIFADDANVFYTSKDFQDLESTMNEEFSKILKYCATNKLSVNLKKTKFMIITNKKLIPRINIANLECTEHIKYLGVYLDNKITWHQHIKHINNKLAKNLGILNKLRHHLNLKMLKQLYYNVIYPYINYGILSWGNTHKTKLLKTQAKLNKAVKLIFFADRRESPKPFYCLLDILNFNNVYRLKTATLTYQILKDTSKVPKPLVDYLTLASSIHTHNTRYSTNQNILRPKARTQYALTTFKFSASKEWEKVPIDLKHVKTLPLFKNKYKLFLLSEQNKC